MKRTTGLLPLLLALAACGGGSSSSSDGQVTETIPVPATREVPEHTLVVEYPEVMSEAAQYALSGLYILEIEDDLGRALPPVNLPSWLSVKTELDPEQYQVMLRPDARREIEALLDLKGPRPVPGATLPPDLPGVFAEPHLPVR